MNIQNETIVKFKNGTELHMPSGIYEKFLSIKIQLWSLSGKKMAWTTRYSFSLVMYSILRRQHRVHLKVKMVV